MAGVRQNGGFFQVPNSVFDLGLSLYELGVYFYLLRCASSEGEAFPSYANIAARTGMTRRKAMQAVARLIELGLLEVVERGDPRRQRANRYRVYRPGERDSLAVSRTNGKSLRNSSAPSAPSPSEPGSPALVNQGNSNNTHSKNTHKAAPSREIGASSKRGLEIEEGFQGKREEERGKTFFAKFAKDKATVIRSASLRASEKGTARETEGLVRLGDALAVPKGHQAHPAGSSGFVRFEAFAEGLSGPEVADGVQGKKEKEGTRREPFLTFAEFAKTVPEDETLRFMKVYVERFEAKFAQHPEYQGGHPTYLRQSWIDLHQALAAFGTDYLMARMGAWFGLRLRRETDYAVAAFVNALRAGGWRQYAR